MVFAILGIMIDKNVGDIVECQAAVPDQRDYHVIFEVPPVLICWVLLQASATRGEVSL